MDDFLKNLSNLNKRQSYRKSLSKETEDENEGVTSPDSTDSLRLEMNLFKPIKKVLRTPPKRYPDGRIREINLTKVTPLKLSFSNFIQSSTSDSNIIEGTKNIPSINSAFVDANSYQKYEEEEIDSSPKRLKLSTDESDIGILKDITLGENNDSNSVSTAQSDSTEKKSATKQIQENNNHHHHHHHHLPHHHLFPSLGKYHTGRKEDGENKSFQTQDYLNPSPTIEEKLIEEQRRIEQIILQEKKDRELALKLSQEWESETIRKPQTRSMITGAVKQRKTNLKTPKSQKTLFESAPIGTRSRRK